MKKLLSSLLVCLVSSTVYAQNTPAPTAGEVDLSQFKRLSWNEMQELANPNRLNRRIFYTPSTGPDAAWFDAVKRGDFAAVQQKIKAGQNIEAKDVGSREQTALGWAAFIGYLDIVKLLVENKANLYASDTADVKHVFKAAVLGGNRPVLEYLYPLMKDKIGLNDRDDGDEEVPLMHATSNHRLASAQFLLEHGANPNLVANAINEDATTYACKANDQEMVAILVKAGAINHKTGKPGC